MLFHFSTLAALTCLTASRSHFAEKTHQVPMEKRSSGTAGSFRKKLSPPMSKCPAARGNLRRYLLMVGQPPPYSLLLFSSLPSPVPGFLPISQPSSARATGSYTSAIQSLPKKSEIAKPWSYLWYKVRLYLQSLFCLLPSH